MSKQQPILIAQGGVVWEIVTQIINQYEGSSQSNLQMLGGEPIEIWMSSDHIDEEDEIVEVMWESVYSNRLSFI